MKDYLVDALMEHFKESKPDAIKKIREYIDKHGAITLRFDMLETDFAKYELREKLKKLEYIPNNTFSAIKKVYFNDPVTVVLWADGTKTIVRAENEEYDPEKGLAMAIAKKSLGNKGSYYETFKKWLPEVTVDKYNVIKEAVKARYPDGFDAEKLSRAFDEAYRLLGEAKGGNDNDSN